jgi:hypothetical protein
MTNRRTLLALVLALVLVVSQISAASATTLNQTTTPTTCTIKTVTQDATGNWVVTCTDGSTATLTETEGIAAGLLNGDGTTQLLFAGDSITLDSTLLTNPCDTSCGSFTGGSTGTSTGTSTGPSSGTSAGGANSPVADALAGFFCGSTGATSSMIQDWHMEGFGFGVIAQALFMANVLGVDPHEVLLAKQNHDFSGITLPDGSTPTNWGQFKKDVLAAEVKSVTNLGAVMSGRAVLPNPTGSATTAAPSLMDTTTHGKSGSHGGGNGHGHGGGNGKGHRP